jgi:hypothetical protein
LYRVSTSAASAASGSASSGSASAGSASAVGGVEVGEQGVPAVGGRLGGEGVLVEVPAEGGFAALVGADVGVQVGADAAGAGNDGDPVGDGLRGG